MPETEVDDPTLTPEDAMPPGPGRLLAYGAVFLVAIVVVIFLIGGLNREGDTPPIVGDERTQLAASRIDRVLGAVSAYQIERLPVEAETNLAATVAGIDEQRAVVRVTRVLAQEGTGVAIVHLYVLRRDQNDFAEAAADGAALRPTTVAGKDASVIDSGDGQLAVAFTENGIGVIVQGGDEPVLIQAASEVRNAARSTT